MTETSGAATEQKFRVWLRPDGILHQVWDPGAAMGLDDAIASIAATRKLSGGLRRPLMVDAHDGGAMDRAAGMEYSRHTFVSAVGMIASTPLSRMSANFFLKVTQPAIPTRMFDDEASAVAWLSKFVT